jgi:hypothetical protein
VRKRAVKSLAAAQDARLNAGIRRALKGTYAVGREGRPMFSSGIGRPILGLINS